jgi:quercetin dioxygenase-like cupin family protein
MSEVTSPLDAMTVAPDHHRVLLENDRVRVLDTHLAPGDTTPVHEHPWPAVLHVLSWSDFVRIDREGNVVLDSRAADMNPEAGAIFWSPPLTPHAVRNVGSRELRIIAIEIKETP